MVFLLFSCSNDKKVEKDKIDDPIEYLTEEISKQPEDYKLYGMRASVFLEQGKLDPALRDLNKALSINPNDSELYVILSDIYFVMGNKENSISALKKAISLDPKNVVPLIKLSEFYLLMGEYEKVQFYADRALMLNMDQAEPYYYKGMAFLEIGDTANSIINLKIASNIDTLNFAANMQLGAIYYSENDSISEIYLKKAIKNQPDNSSALYYLGMLYQDNKEFDKALNVYAELINNTKSGKRAYYNSAYIYLVELQDYEKAEEMFLAAISIDPDFVEAVYNLGRTYEAKGNFEQARVQYQKSIEILPNYPLAVQGLNRLDQ